VRCIRRDNGKEIWTTSTRGAIDSSPVICGDKVVVGSDDGRLYLLRLADGRKLWSYLIGEAISGSPAVVAGPGRADATVVIGADNGRVYAFGPD